MGEISQTQLRNVTLVFLIKRLNGAIAEVCLAMKKRRFGAGRWNGYGGKLEGNETIEQALRREALEEAQVTLGDINKVGEIDFHFPHNPAWDQKVHIYLCESWQGEPKETEEMRPQWFKISDIPYHEMWAADHVWIPEVLAGKTIKGEVVFGEEDSVVSSRIEAR